ncbi:MAG TPA: hypothetical protein VK149_09065 [Sideroxyarcus sp.]|nr:hypothetical protein [Sideroxyarcus sp.]
MNVHGLIDALESQLADPAQGLPEELFLFVSRLTPIVNVDLLLKNSENETLLTWREDQFYGPCWHVPGGIIRFKETAAKRIHAVAEAELGASVEFEQTPLAINELMARGRNTRGHFISLLYDCRLTSPLDPARAYASGAIRHGEWAWHATCPENLIPSQGVYKKFIDGRDASRSN